MRAESLKILLKNNMDMVFQPENYEEYIKQVATIRGYNFLNRCLIFIQNRKSTDVRSEMSWAEAGRKINETNNPIHILVPVYRTSYIDTETTEEVTDPKLTPIELNQAVMLGILKRNREIIDFKSTLVYDIQDTTEIEGSYKDNGNNRNIKLSNLCRLGKQLCGMNISNKTKKTYYDSSNRTLYVGKEREISQLPTLIEVIVKSLVDRIDENYRLNTMESDDEQLENMPKIDGIHRRIIEDSVVYAICYGLGVKPKIDLSISERLYEESIGDEHKMDRVQKTMDCVGSLVDIVVYTGMGVEKKDQESEIDKFRRAEQLLDIIEANYTLWKIKNGHQYSI